ncbi:MAG: OsmC family protein [Eubacteriales bacterium]|nr:OsmC family protein [Eubacteriales bacterium]
MAQILIKAQTKLMEGYTVECRAGEHMHFLDEPKALGGNDKGMSPVQALLSALGGCECAIARGFARKKGINLLEFRVELEGAFDPDGYKGRNPEAKVGFTKIISKIHVKADNTEEEIREYVKFVESHCPVGATMANSPVLETEVVIE